MLLKVETLSVIFPVDRKVWTVFPWHLSWLRPHVYTWAEIVLGAWRKAQTSSTFRRIVKPPIKHLNRKVAVREWYCWSIIDCIRVYRFNASLNSTNPSLSYINAREIDMLESTNRCGGSVIANSCKDVFLYHKQTQATSI